MSSEGAVRARRQQLYGAARTHARDAAKKLLETDHVAENFQKGVEPLGGKETFRSETAASFRRHQPASTRGTHWSPSSQNATHINLGSDSQPLSSVVRSDFTSKPMGQHKLHFPEGLHDINIADLAPKYMADKSFGRSLYHQDFDGNKVYDVWSSEMARQGRKVGRRRETTAYQKATHFELGSDPQSLKSETSCCFTERSQGRKQQEIEEEEGGVDRSKSNVFRPGDYDAPLQTPREHFLSVQQQDYHPRTADQLPAGVSTATKKGYSHVFPRKPVGEAIGALRKLLVDKNTEDFQNPRDPTAINVMKAFLKYDQTRSGSVGVEELGAVCRGLGHPISPEEVQDLLRECDTNRDGRIDYVEFTKYLSAHTEPHSTEQEFVSTHRETFPTDTMRSGQSSAKGEFMGVDYQTSTHFQLGDDTEPPATIYNKDFGAACNDSEVRLTVRPPPPPSSKVMHEFPVVGPASTTSRKAYIRHNVTAREKERLSALERNRAKHEKLGVVLSSGRELDKDHYQASTMGSSYTSPASFSRTQPVDPAPKDYHHLESNRALPHPYKPTNRTEVQECFSEPLRSGGERVERIKGALDERTSRIGDNKSTHFILGFQHQPPQSEKMAEFGHKAQVSLGLQAAGKPSGPTCGYSVISHDDGERPESADSSASSGLQNLLQQRNFLKNVNPRDPLNVNLRKAFLEYDKDLSGTINREELEMVCKAMDIHVSEKDLEELTKRCDKNGDGQIDYHEFALYLSRQQPPAATDPQLTTTRKDFKHPNKQKLSQMQRLVLAQDKKRYIPLQPTHFFHLDSHDDYLLSTTRKDFVYPEAHPCN